MKTYTMILFGAFLFVSMAYVKEAKENKELKKVLHDCDSVNKINKITLDSFKLSNKNYSDQFNVLFDEARRMRK